MGGLRYQFVTLDLTDSLQNAIDGIRNRAAALGIDLSLEKPDPSAVAGVTISADVQRIDQLLHNLLENSLAYTDGLGRVTVTLSRTTATALVTIDDTPPGVSESDCEQLFDPLFRQEASRNRRSGGAGLGLAICRIQNAAWLHGAARPRLFP